MEVGGLRSEAAPGKCVSSYLKNKKKKDWDIARQVQSPVLQKYKYVKVSL
jgi:hypothetical protein